MRSSGALIALAALLCAPKALAAGPTESEMAGHMNDWFEGERNEAFVFLGLGFVSLGGGTYLATREEDLAKGAGYTGIALGGLITIFAITYNLGLNPKHDELKQQLAKDPAAYKREETERMEGISDRFVLYRWSEIGLLAIGAGLTAYGLIDDKDVVTGVGIVLAGEAALVLGLDYFAERRAHTYLDHLRDFEATAPSASPLKSGGFVLGYGASF